MTKIQKTTIVLLVLYLVWEFIVQIWARGEKGPIIRADLFFILPVLAIMVLLSIIQWIKRR